MDGGEGISCCDNRCDKGEQQTKKKQIAYLHDGARKVETQTKNLKIFEL